jgi:O-antigen/teichoic acid export membrane protein
LSTQALLAAYFAGKNRLSVNLIGSIISLIIIIAGDVVLIPLYGIKAAAAVSSLGYIFYLFYSLYMFRKENESSVIDFFILKRSDMSYIINLFQKADL